MDEVDFADREWTRPMRRAVNQIAPTSHGASEATIHGRISTPGPLRFIQRFIDTDEETEVVFDGAEWLIRETPKGRYQFKVLVAGTPGNVRGVVDPASASTWQGRKLKKCLHLRQP